MKRNLIIIIAIVAVFSGYNFWINTPQYSLLQIQKSVEEKDLYLFEKHVDTERIIEEIVEDLSKLLLEQMEDVESSDSSLFDSRLLVTGLVSIFQPTIENTIKDSFENFWEDGIENSETRTEFQNNFESFEMSYIKRDGKVARLGLEGKYPDSREIIKIEFKLNKIENYWRVTKILNLEELLREQMDEVENFIDLEK